MCECVYEKVCVSVRVSNMRACVRVRVRVCVLAVVRARVRLGASRRRGELWEVFGNHPAVVGVQPRHGLGT